MLDQAENLLGWEGPLQEKLGEKTPTPWQQWGPGDRQGQEHNGERHKWPLSLWEDKSKGSERQCGPGKVRLQHHHTSVVQFCCVQGLQAQGQPIAAV